MYSYVQEEEDHRHAILNPTTLSSIEKSVILSSNQRDGRGGSRGRGGRSNF